MTQHISAISLDPFNSSYDRGIFKARGSFLIPQLYPFLAHIIPAKLENGKYSAASVLKKLAEDEEYEVNGAYFSGSQISNFYKLFHFENVSTYVAAQTSATHVCAAVPIVMAAYKTMHGIKYSSWDLEEFNGTAIQRFFNKQMSWIFNKELLVPELDRDKVTALRERALLERKSGVVKPATSYKFEKTDDAEFDALPRMLKMLLLQTWVFHPQIRHEDMVTNLADWDTPMEPWDALDAQLLARPNPVKPQKDQGDLPW